MKTMSIELLRELIDYDPGTGGARWKHRARHHFKSDHSYKAWNTKHAHSAINGVSSEGYIRVVVLGQLMQLHRVIWAMTHGEWPDGPLDHINHDGADNRIANLRVVTHQQNLQNASMPANNTSGVVGVYRSTRGKPWRAQICVDRKIHHLGYFDTIEEATTARKDAERTHNFHPNHGDNQ